MVLRRRLAALAVAAAAGIALAAAAAAPARASDPTQGATAGKLSTAGRVWQLGQLALERDRFEEAIGQFQVCLRLDAKFVQAHLSLAAAYIALAREREALPHLESYLLARPDHFLIRAHYGEVLMRLGRLADAGRQLERFVAEVQPYDNLSEAHLLTSHTRLMEIAADRRDEYNEHLHRGIGLFLLAKKRTALGDERSAEIAEELLCRSAAELTLARLAEPGRARPCWYLFGVWDRLAQRQPAMRWLRAAEGAGRVPLGDLTPSEQYGLEMALQGARQESRRK